MSAGGEYIRWSSVTGLSVMSSTTRSIALERVRGWSVTATRPSITVMIGLIARRPPIAALA